MTEDELKAAAVEAVKKREPKSKSVRATGLVNKFLGGTLVIVHSTDENGDEAEDLVFFRDHEISIYSDAEEMAKSLRNYGNESHFARLLNIGGITGILAVIIVVALCYVMVFGLAATAPDNVVGALTNALGAIIGFYFGSAVTKKL